MPLCTPLDIAKSSFELEVGAAQRGFRVHFFPARQVHEGEEQVTQFVHELPVIGSLFDLPNLFGDLVQHALDFRPVKADASGSVLIILRLAEGGQRKGNAVQQAFLFVALASFFFLKLLPIGKHAVYASHLEVAKYVRMPPNDLPVDISNNIVDGELPLFTGDLRIEHDLQEKVSEFLAHALEVIQVHGRDRFIGFLKQVLTQCRMRLLLIPWAAVRGAQVGDDLLEGLERGSLAERRHVE